MVGTYRHNTECPHVRDARSQRLALFRVSSARTPSSASHTGPVAWVGMQIVRSPLGNTVEFLVSCQARCIPPSLQECEMKSRLIVVAACLLAVMPNVAVAQKPRVTRASAAAEPPVLPTHA